MANATFKQTAVIWKFCGQYGSANTDWAKLAKTGDLDKEYASDLIGLIFDWKKSGSIDERNGILGCIQNFIPSFEIIKAHDSQSTDPSEAIPEEEENEQGQGEAKVNELEQLLSAMSALLNKDAVKSLKQAIEAEKERIEEKYLNAVRNSEKMVDALKAEIEKIKEQGTLPVIAPMSESYIKHEKFDMVGNLVKAKQNVLLTGPAGTGKSRMAREVALALAMPCYTLSLGGGMRYAQVYGSTQLDKNESRWTPAPFLQWVQQPCVIVLEEIFGADPDVILGMNQILEPSTREISTPIGTIEVHADCRFIACANTTGRSVSRQYSGAQRADDSLLSRFSAKVFIDYDQKVEAKILETVADDTARDYFADTLSKLRQNIKEANIGFDAGTRELISTIGNYAAGLPYKVAFEVAFLGGLSHAERAKIGV